MDERMNTKLEVLTKDEEANQKIYEAAGVILRRGGLVAFPTETVYGLGGDALNPWASARIYEAKGRPSDNPLIVHIADVKALEELASEVPKEAYTLAEKFWPGPLTMILKKKECVPKATTGGLDTVAIRMPNHPVALELIRTSKVYIAAPSANLSGRPSPTKASHVKEDLFGRIDMILDGGEGEIGIESTIIDLTSSVPTILRPGFITKEALEKELSKVVVDPAIDTITRGYTKNTDASLHPKAPGMKYRHYAPKGDMMIVEHQGDASICTEKEVEKIAQLLQKAKDAGHSTAVLATEETKEKYPLADHVLVLGKRNEPQTISSNLFDILRQCDTLGVEEIFSESFERSEEEYAIMNRLVKAAGGKILLVE